MAFTDRELLARIIKCEAGGEGDDGMRAVATVIMNRVDATDGEYQREGQGSISRVIFQPGQFDCVREIVGGKPNSQTIFTNEPEPIHFEIADWAIGGGRLNEANSSLWYFNPHTAVCRATFPRGGSGTLHTRINLHCFYRPTPQYSET